MARWIGYNPKPLTPTQLRSLVQAAVLGQSVSILIRSTGIRKRTEQGFVIAAVFEKFAKLPKSKAVEIARRSLLEANGCVRSWAVSLLRTLGIRFTQSLIIQLSNDKDPLVREEIIWVLSERSGAKATTALIRFLQDPEEFVRNTAAEAFFDRSSPRAIAPLSRMLRDSGMVGRCSAAEALGASHLKAAIPPLRKAIGDRSEVVRGYVITALGELQNRGSIPLLEQIHRRKNERDRMSSCVALYLLGEDRRLEEMAAYLHSRHSCAAGNNLVWMVRKADLARAAQILRKAIHRERTTIGRRALRRNLKDLRDRANRF